MPRKCLGRWVVIGIVKKVIILLVVFLLKRMPPLKKKKMSLEYMNEYTQY